MKQLAACMAIGLLAGCLEEGGQYRYAIDVSQLELVLTGPTMGVHPDVSILDVRQNPFVDGVGEPRWEMLSDEQWIASFYAWGSENAIGGNGERQYYTALSAHQIYLLRLSEPSDVVWVRDIAIGGYQAVLDEFPDDLTYDITGTIGWRLAPLAYDGILSLGGTPEGDWVQVTQPDGTVTVVRP